MKKIKENKKILSPLLPQAIDYDLSSTAARLEGSLPRAKIPNSSRPTSLRADEHEGGGLATTWPLGSSSLRVDGHGLSNTLPKDVGISVADSCNNQVRPVRFSRCTAGTVSAFVGMNCLKMA